MYGLTFSGWIATISGWYITEIGRQPWLVSGILKTKDAVASNVSQNMIMISFVSYLLIYLLLIYAFIKVLFYMANLDLLRDDLKSDVEKIKEKNIKCSN